MLSRDLKSIPDLIDAKRGVCRILEGAVHCFKTVLDVLYDIGAFGSLFNAKRTQMNAVADVLRSKKLVDPNSIQQLVSSNVPILKFRSCDGVNVDLQFNNIPSIRSSLFVRACVEFSMIVPINIHWINAFFKAAGLKDSRHGLFSSYHLNMLALHFLQATPLPLLPDMISSCPYLQPTVPWQNVAERLTTEASCIITAEVPILTSVFLAAKDNLHSRQKKEYQFAHTSHQWGFSSAALWKSAVFGDVLTFWTPEKPAFNDIHDEKEVLKQQPNSLSENWKTVVDGGCGEMNPVQELLGSAQ
ncbi:unnamed protein product [Angiostrongylus costaricensis]|uniref:PAP-associated domain-containing protein n=1 Tax=Angiostrongylus costaricensis TaxID=334426 RepID=A0A0R3PWN8_ANGCS|nr:unnamed protein product [Angiostrongylus costaricensis]